MGAAVWSAQSRRTSTNIRYYTSEDLKLLLNVSLLNQNGHKISRIATMGESEMGEALRALKPSPTGKTTGWAC